jgi:hypothetical protein
MSGGHASGLSSPGRETAPMNEVLAPRFLPRIKRVSKALREDTSVFQNNQPTNAD